jgi:hypothetical protein
MSIYRVALRRDAQPMREIEPECIKMSLWGRTRPDIIAILLPWWEEVGRRGI